MIRIVVMGRCVCGLEVVGIACYSFPGVLWTENACVGDSYWDSREMEYARSAMGKAESVFLVGVDCRLGRWRARECLISGRDLLVLCESRVSAWLWRCAMLPAEVCRVAGHPVEVRCLSSEVCRADRAAESHRVAGHPAESRRADCCGGAPSHWPRYAVTPCHWSSCGGAPFR